MHFTISIHRVEKPLFTVCDEQTGWLSINGHLNGVTIFFDTPAAARSWLADAITAVNRAEDAPKRYDAHLEADYDDRNGD